MALTIRVIQLITSIMTPWASVNLAKNDVNEKCEFRLACGVPFFISINRAGKSRNVITRERVIPALIIQPKVITGRISQSSSEPNPAIVVSAAYRQGLSIKETASRISFRCSASGLLKWSSRYRTIRWMVIAMVKISCKDIKLEDITVTSQPNNPSSPIIEIAEKAQQRMGKKIQRIFLKTTLKATTRRNNTPRPNVLRSFLIKLIRSSAIMLIPPRKSSAS